MIKVINIQTTCEPTEATGSIDQEAWRNKMPEMAAMIVVPAAIAKRRPT